MPTTTNFGWTTPADTDLVKDGAAAIRTALGGVDTSFVDLKGGTTGQVLLKNTSTDLDFVWSAPPSANPSFSLLSTTTLTGASTFTISSLSGYNTFYLIIKNASSTSASQAMEFRINGNTGNVYRAYGVTIDPGASYSTSLATQNVQETTSATMGVMSNNAGSQVTGFVRLEGCNSSGIKMFHSASGVGPEGGNSGANRILGGFIEDTNVVSSITFLTSGGNFDVGTLRIYGSVA